VTRRIFNAALAAGALVAAPARPNVVIVLCDDLGYGDVGAFFPAAKVATPRLDRLAREGMRFVDAHSPSGVCTPTRYGLLTGRYCWRTKLTQGVLNGYSPALLEPGRTTLAALLAREGYRTGGFGKWHLGLGTAEKVDYARPFSPGPLQFGFGEYFGIPASLDMPPYVYLDGDRAVEPPTASIADNGEVKRGPFWRGGPRAPGFVMEEVLPKIAERAERFLRGAVRSAKPFFAYIPLPAPHTPWVPSKPFQGKSKAGLYGDFVGEVDAVIGRIADAVAGTNTLLLVTSDNGAPWEARDGQEAAGHQANGTWRGQKSDVQEGGHRVPLLAHWPGRIAAGGLSTQLVCLTDLFATVAELVGVKLGEGMAEDSISFAPALRGEGPARMRTAVVHHSGNGLFAIRDREWKLVLGRGSGGFTAPAKVEPGPGEPVGELYHLVSDPREEHNVYAEQPAVVARLRDQLATWQRQGRSR
jgi:arylsulfatase A